MIHATRARLYFQDGRVVHYADQSLAYQVWLSFPQGVRVAFRGVGDDRPVYPWDYADRRGS
jgi:hypothetical protein